MRKITDGYARQNLRRRAKSIGIEPSDIQFSNNIIDVEKMRLELIRTLRRKTHDLKEITL